MLLQLIKADYTPVQTLFDLVKNKRFSVNIKEFIEHGLSAEQTVEFVQLLEQNDCQDELAQINGVSTQNWDFHENLYFGLNLVTERYRGRDSTETEQMLEMLEMM